MQDFDPIAYQAFLDAAQEKYDFKTCARKDGTTYGIPRDSDCGSGRREVSAAQDKFVKKSGQEIAKVAGPYSGGGPGSLKQRRLDFWKDSKAALDAANDAKDAGDVGALAHANNQILRVAAEYRDIAHATASQMSVGEDAASNTRAHYRDLMGFGNKDRRLLMKRGYAQEAAATMPPRPARRPAAPRPQPQRSSGGSSNTGMKGLDQYMNALKQELNAAGMGGVMSSGGGYNPQGLTQEHRYQCTARGGHINARGECQVGGIGSQGRTVNKQYLRGYN